MFLVHSSEVYSNLFLNSLELFQINNNLNNACPFQSLAALLRPFGMCAEFLNPEVIRTVLANGMERAIKYVQNLEEKDFKEKVCITSYLSQSMTSLHVADWLVLHTLDHRLSGSNLAGDKILSEPKSWCFIAKSPSCSPFNLPDRLKYCCKGCKALKTSIHPSIQSTTKATK